MENAARRRKECLAAWREHLTDLAILRDDDCVTADDALYNIERKRLEPLGNAAGNLARVQLESRPAGRCSLCYRFLMPRIIERQLLFQYVGGELTPLSEPLKTKDQAQRVRLKYPERERKAIGIGVIRTKDQPGSVSRIRL